MLPWLDEQTLIPADRGLSLIMVLSIPFMRWTKLFIAAMLMLGLSPAIAAEQNALAMSLVFQRSLPSILSITVRDHNGVLRRGSGFFVNDNGLFITGFNVVENAQRITVRSEDGWIYTVNDVIALAKERDLALLRVPLVKTRPIDLRKTDQDPQPGEIAIAVASSEGLGWHMADGQIEAAPENLPDQESEDLLFFSAPVKAGNQGGPLVDRYGRLLGVILPPIETDAEPALHRAVPVRYVRELMARLVTLPLSATWTTQPVPPKPPIKTLVIEPEEALAEAPETAETGEPEAVEEEQAPPVEVAEQAPAAPPAHLQTQALDSRGGNAQHIGQVRRLYWQTVPGDLEPGRVCPPMISLHLEDEFGIRTAVYRKDADAGMNLSGRVDTGQDCNMWGCFDGYRLFMNFAIVNGQGKVLFRDYFEVDEDDVDEACEELAEDIVDELEDYLD